jgi:chromosome partitioning protein
MKAIAVAQQKGGVGKSTVAIHLAEEASRDGLTAFILELDKQGTASTWGERRGAGNPPDVMKIESGSLAQHLRALRGLSVDLVILDLPGAHSPAVTPAIKAADLVLIPSRPNEVDITASAETLSAAHRLEKPYAYVLTFTEPTGGKTKEARTALIEAGHPVAEGEISRRQVFVDAVASGQTAFEIEPKGKGAAEIRKLWAWIKTQMELGGK